MTSDTEKKRGRTWWARIATFTGVCLLLAFYAAVQVHYFTPAYCEDDPDGYLYLAKQFSTGAKVGIPDADPFLHQNHVWVTNHRGEMLPKFTPGYSWLMAPFYRFGGDVACFYVSPIMGGLTLLAAYLLFRQWLPRLPSFCGLVALTFNGMFLAYSGFLLTHATDMAFTTWGMYLLWRWRKEPGVFNAIGTGLCLGFALTVRPVNALLALTILSAAIPRLREDRRAGCVRWGAFLSLGAAYAVFPILWMIYNAHMFGNPLHSGYALTHEQGAFSPRFILTNIALYTRGLNDNLFLVFPLGILGLFVFGSKRDRFMRASWFGSLMLLYCSYYWPYCNFASLRFMLPVFPLITGAAFGLVWDGTVSTGRRRAILTVALTTLILVSNGEHAVNTLKSMTANPAARRIAEIGRGCAGLIRDDAVIFASNPACYHLGTRRQYRCYSLDAFEPLKPGRNGEGSSPRWQTSRFDLWQAFYANTLPSELKRMKRQLIRDHLDGQHQVVFILPRGLLKRQMHPLGPDYVFTTLKEFDFTDVVPGQGEVRNTWGIYEISLLDPLKASPSDNAVLQSNREILK